LRVRFSALRGERIALPGGIVLINDCYNANPMSMRAAIEDLTETAFSSPAPARRLAVLGDMLELGPEAPAFHRELGPLAGTAGVDLLIAVGPLAAFIADAFDGDARCLADAAQAADTVPGLLEAGDLVLVKGSLGVGLARVCEALGARVPA
jgi:UDP-N-acetylmuramoyl-tripeptide--D-alanyl-D-alanine ligase